MVGNDARTLLSLVISCPPGASGTLKSTRMKAVLPLRFKSRIDTLGILLRFLKTDGNSLPKTRWGDESRLQGARFLKRERIGRCPISVQPRDRVPLNCAKPAE